MKEIHKIVITGGPCGGKSEALDLIKEHYSELGWKVLIVPETPTELIQGGVAPWTCGSPFQYQMCQMEVHKKMEEVFIRAAKGMKEDKILIVCDRGQFDCLAYMTQEEFDFVSDLQGVDTEELLKSYDIIIHLESVAVKYPELYTLGTNVARIEDAATAAELDHKTREAWKKHVGQVVIEAELDFNTKMQKMIKVLDEKISYVGFHDALSVFSNVFSRW